MTAETLKVRIALDVDLQDDIEDLQKLFYFLDESGEFISEVDEQKKVIDYLEGIDYSHNQAQLFYHLQKNNNSYLRETEGLTL